MLSSCRRPVLVTALSVALLGASAAARAQTATIEGTLSNFDVVNETGYDAHGFELQIEGAAEGDLYYTALGQQYGTARTIPYATGVKVRWESPYDASAHQFTKTTPQHTPGVPYSWNDCYLPGSTYKTAGCEALGQGMFPTPGKTITATGRWLIEDPQNPGTLITVEPNVAIPFPNWSVAGGVAGASPLVVAEVEAPEPPETPEVYGDAQWVKIYKAQLTREATPADLTSDNPTVPQDASQLEVAWDILQASPPSNGNQKRKQNQGGINADTRSIIRRYETYKYTGAYDAITHQAVCADGLCAAPSAGELGDFIGAQNTAVNVLPDALVVTKTGSGSVSGSGAKINCGSACSAFAPKGTAVTLTANPGNNVFTGWTGACSGTQLTCTVSVSGPVAVGAAFLPQFTLSVSRSNSGSVVGSPTGNDRRISCPGDCSAKFTQATTVTLTAIPAAGKTFVSWGGACSGTAPTCTVFITQSTSVQANFSK
jgi:Divergent InlB B-repeat domain